MVNIETNFVGLKLKSPIIVSSAGITETVDRMRKCQDNGAGAVVMKSFFEETLSRKSPTPRFQVLEHPTGKYRSFTLFSYEQGSIWDIERYAKEVSEAKKQLQIKIIPSINCITDEGWVESAKAVEKAGADAIELNTSCPHGSITFRGGEVENSIAKTVSLVVDEVHVPVIAKISPMLTSPFALAKRLEEVGVNGVTIFNRMTALEIDIEKEKPSLHGGYGGHGGPWAIQYPLRWISEIRPKIKIDIAGSSGVIDWRGVVKYILVGANAVQICTAVFMYGYEVIGQLLNGLKEFMERKGYSRLDDFRGKVNSKILSAEQVDRRPRYVAKIKPEIEAPCNHSCPAGVPAQSYVRLIAEGKYVEALALIQTKNPFQSICGRVCYHPCEDNCIRGDLDDPIAIKALKRFVIEWGERNNLSLDTIKVDKAPSTGKKVAIFGAGPAGLSAAHDLSINGYEVTVFEKDSVIGGMLRLGIPDYRLPKTLLDKEVQYIKNQGVKIKTNMAFGGNLKIQSLKDEGFDAILLALGSQKSLQLQVSGEDSVGVISALDFLKQVNLGKKVNIQLKVAIVGGGNSAIDAARCAIRLGAREVYLIYRRTRYEMPANEQEINDAEEEGVRVIYLAKPVEVVLRGNKVKGLKCVGGYLSQRKSGGRRIPAFIKDTEYTLPVDMIITALGQIPESSILKDQGLRLDDNAAIITNNETGSTNIEGVFAAGDVAGKPASVIEAIAHGKRVAAYIDQYLKGKDLDKIASILPESKIVDKKSVLARSLDKAGPHRAKLPRISVDSRKKSFKEVDLTLPENQARREAERCLACGCGVGCDLCYRICIYSAVEPSINKYIVNDENCDGCGLCVERCPNDAISLIEKT